MQEPEAWNWEPGDQTVPLNGWKNQYQWVEEPQASPDGESVAAIVKQDEAEFTICVNGAPWESSFEKIWHLRYSPDGRLAALVADTGAWTVACDGQSWENQFDYAWDLSFSPDGAHISVCIQQAMQYAMAAAKSAFWTLNTARPSSVAGISCVKSSGMCEPPS